MLQKICIWNKYCLFWTFYSLKEAWKKYILLSIGQNKHVVSFLHKKIMLNDNGTLFHPYFDILFSQKLFETLKYKFAYLHLICFLCI